MADGTLTVKVSPKGAVQVNGLRRFPVTFYADEWRQLFAAQEGIQSFILRNADRLSSKGDSAAADGEVL